MTSAIVTENSELAVRVRQLESTNQNQQSRIQHLEAENQQLRAEVHIGGGTPPELQSLKTQVEQLLRRIQI